MDLGIKSFEHAVPTLLLLVLREDLQEELDHLLKTNAGPAAKQALTKKAFWLGPEAVDLSKLKQLAEKMVQNEAYLCPTLQIYRTFTDAAQQTEAPDEPLIKYLEAWNTLGDFLVDQMSQYHVKILVGQDLYDPELTLAKMGLLKKKF